MESLQKKRTTMMRYNGVVCPKVVKRIEKMKEDDKGWISRWCSNDEFEVIGPNMVQYKVYIDKRRCGCRKWDISGIPCIHVIAALGFNNLEPLDYVHDCYRVDTYMRTYDNLMGPINGKDMWPSTDNVKLLPPDIKKRAGRPKKARRREPEEPKDPIRLGRKGIKMTCSSCGNVGHNKRGCKKNGQEVNAGEGSSSTHTQQAAEFVEPSETQFVEPSQPACIISSMQVQVNANANASASASANSRANHTQGAGNARASARAWSSTDTQVHVNASASANARVGVNAGVVCAARATVNAGVVNARADTSTVQPAVQEGHSMAHARIPKLIVSTLLFVGLLV
ncbi:hypothetical protein RHMOL_Rhmol02G0043400 [Rhododendron molle]|uniref:Uncharacterized protein n=1 Tax=Rhododendron molle TaxID=49168 RepID=A0ACC0PPM9_RHOML|nr:hypothetical protein RHMOL_Rhmol02G0043400 [Rhododendron molle]